MVEWVIMGVNEGCFGELKRVKVEMEEGWWWWWVKVENVVAFVKDAIVGWLCGGGWLKKLMMMGV
ncbi:hypothetical protein Hanom_Chr04g00311341 [Helianthus anomalus]